MNTGINQIILPNNKNPIRVLFIITQSELGGAQRFISQLLPNLSKNNFELTVATGRDGKEELQSLLPANTKYINTKNLRRNPNLLSDILSLFEIKKIIKQLSPDVLFLNSSKAGFIGSLSARLLKPKQRQPKVIYRIGGWTFNDPWPLWKKILYRWLEKISAKWKDYIIVNNKHDYDQAIKFGIKPRKKVELIYNGIDPYKLDFLEKDEAKIRLYEKLPPSEKHGSFLHKGLLIGTIANFYPAKGLEYLIDAFSSIQSPTANLIIIGDGQGRQDLESRIKNLGLENKVFLAGHILNGHKYLKAFDIFVLPSVKEGFPWSLLEAMSAKLAVVATSVGAIPEIIEDGKNGFLAQPANAQSLAKAIKELYSNEDMRREFGIQAHQTIIHKFSLNKMVEQTKEILQKGFLC
ncbi:MAG TPA: glycosyltransferase family 4 protein [Candidatus Paceibacterota bacterium]